MVVPLTKLYHTPSAEKRLASILRDVPVSTFLSLLAERDEGILESGMRIVERISRSCKRRAVAFVVQSQRPPLGYLIEGDFLARQLSSQ